MALPTNRASGNQYVNPTDVFVQGGDLVGRDGEFAPFYGDFQSFIMEVIKGNVPGYSFITKFAHTEGIGTSISDVWDEGGIYVYPADAGVAMTASSSSANDTSAGTGARTIRIFGLTGTTFLEQQEDVILNGQTAVNLVNTYSRIWRVQVLTGGSGGENAGDIYIGAGALTTGKPATVYARIFRDTNGGGHGENQTLMSHYTVPAGKTAYALFHGWSANGGKDIEVWMYGRPFGGVFNVVDRSMVIDTTTNSGESFIVEFAEKTDIVQRARGTVTSDVACRYSLLLRTNSV